MVCLIFLLLLPVVLPGPFQSTNLPIYHAEVRRLQSRLTEFEVMAAEAPALAKLAPPATAMQMQTRQSSLSVDRRVTSPSPLAPSPNGPNASQTPMLGPEIAEARKRISAVLAQRGTTTTAPTSGGAPGATPPSQRFTMDEIEETKRHFMSLPTDADRVEYRLLFFFFR